MLVLVNLHSASWQLNGAWGRGCSQSVCTARRRAGVPRKDGTMTVHRVGAQWHAGYGV